MASPAPGVWTPTETICRHWRRLVPLDLPMNFQATVGNRQKCALRVYGFALAGDAHTADTGWGSSPAQQGWWCEGKMDRNQHLAELDLRQTLVHSLIGPR